MVQSREGRRGKEGTGGKTYMGTQRAGTPGALVSRAHAVPIVPCSSAGSEHLSAWMLHVSLPVSYTHLRAHETRRHL
eukprot:3704673-Prorocentrum_lima.AAC.1